MRSYTIIILIFAICSSCKTIIREKDNSKIAVNWVNNLEGDFSFTEKWEYPEGIYKNEFGQLSCDGLCPPEADKMKNKNGKIIPDSLDAFYQLVDTTHLFHTFKSETNAYEWFESNFIKFRKLDDNSISGRSLTAISTHSSLNIDVRNDSATALIDYNSIVDTTKYRSLMKKGEIFIDKFSFKKGIIKAEFNFRFLNTKEKEQEIYWKGLIWCPID